MTKAEERKTLEKIEGILKTLENDSYIAQAFDGCIEMARQNIDYDFYNNPKKTIENLREKYDNEAKRRREDRKKYSEIESKEDEKNRLLSKNTQEITELNSKISELDKKTKAQEQTIIELKAKLYDMMTA